MAVLQLELGDLLILGELGLPRGLIHRRHRPGKRRPFGDRKTRIGQARQATHNDHDGHEGEQKHQPQPNGPTRTTAARSAFDRAGLWGVARALVGVADFLENAAGLGHLALRFAFGR